eukprot:CAMPEP_0183339864 /NCGR_PEP_ID=MMETSP0164_2-20130417/6631_1 /TAXON_ID=221442 /ORGANISM="Coccolithus pelagicus ssp braarudi, Strain PLY182g" /LENGTH=206 /DNA_ID=CAMNT_0025509929 /DNA_START=69 /DNA_END=686 /DNA_ORIENTATION=-
MKKTSNESYATLVYGESAHACAAAVLVRVLRELDARRHITVVAYNISAATVRLLEASAPRINVVLHGQATLRAIDSAVAVHARKMWLWALPFVAVLYFDADHIPTLVSSQRGSRTGALARRRAALDRVWNLNGELVASHLPQKSMFSCFNGGFMRLSPSLQTVVRHTTLLESGVPSASQRRCPHGMDRPYLNHLFPRWTRIDEDVW